MKKVICAMLALTILLGISSLALAGSNPDCFAHNSLLSRNNTKNKFVAEYDTKNHWTVDLEWWGCFFCGQFDHWVELNKKIAPHKKTTDDLGHPTPKTHKYITTCSGCKYSNTATYACTVPGTHPMGGPIGLLTE